MKTRNCVLLLIICSIHVFGQQNSIPQKVEKLETEVSKLKSKIGTLEKSVEAKQEKGDPGKDGSVWYYGKNSPKDTLGKERDFYLNTSYNDVFMKSNGSWTKITNIKGSQGDKGLQGERGYQGEKGYQGERGLQGERGVKGDCAELEDVQFGIGWMRVYNESRKEICYIGKTTTEDGILNIMDRNGNAAVQIYVKEDLGPAFYQREPSYSGKIRVNGVDVHDYSEVFEMKTLNDIIPGSMMSMSIDGKGLILSNEKYDNKTVGVISGAGGLQSGMSIGTRKDGSNDFPIALSGQVYVRVCNEGGAIEVGDLLVSSSIPGVAMKATDKFKALGCVVGKALQPFDGSEKTEGLVLMLVMTK